MVAVFAPDADVARARENLPEGEGRRSLVGRVCDHIDAIPERRAETEAPTAYRLLFERQGFGRPEAIVLDAS